MKKNLVTTDLFANSKAALRFAIQLASQNNYQFTFLHVYQMLRRTSWTDPAFISFENSEHKRIEERLYKLVSSLYNTTTSGEGFDFVIKNMFLRNDFAVPLKATVELFLSSMSAEYSFLSKRPLLVIKKDQG